MKQPIIMVSSWPPRKCGIATFAEEAVEFIRKRFPDRKVYVISHLDGKGDDVFPIIDTTKSNWDEIVAKKILQLDPYVVHIQHEYGLYRYVDKKGRDDKNRRFLRLLDRLKHLPTIVEPHTVHGRLKEWEEEFICNLGIKSSVLILKCHYQKWRLEWLLGNRMPSNIMIVPHGARADRRYGPEVVDDLKKELGLGQFVGKHIVGLVGWIQNNKRWDILTSMWEDLHNEIVKKTKQEWFLFAAGDMRDPEHLHEFEKYVHQVKLLEEKGLGHFFQFIPRGEIYYKVMAICDFVVLPTIDETQSGTLARIIALNKPYITTAPLEGLTAQTVESEGGLLFTSKAILRKKILELATSEALRMRLGNNLKKYLDEVVNWERIANEYARAYKAANDFIHKGKKVEFAPEF
jgi:glycosyltransferase involved in cell wall biosynthesis